MTETEPKQATSEAKPQEGAPETPTLASDEMEETEPEVVSASSRAPNNANIASKATATAKNIGHKTTATAKHITNKTKDILHRTEAVVEHNVLCTPLRWIIHFPRHWPRTSSFFLGVVIPLWVLILLSFGFGILLSEYESPPEVADNDAILAARARIAYYDVSAETLLNATGICLAQWKQQVLDGTEDAVGSGLAIDPTNETKLEELLDNFLAEHDSDNDGFAYVNISFLDNSLESCLRAILPQLQQLSNATNENSLAFESLSFNWNRCWNRTEFGTYVFHPTQDQIDAANPVSQEEFFQEEWSRMQEELYEKYLPVNATPEEELEAFMRSVDEATGDDACYENTGGTGWFFFTIMTTVGYGNQAPITDEGRLLIATAGLASLILFGAVLGICGHVIITIFNDFTGRLKYAHFLRNPVVGMFLWGTIWLLFALTIATDVEWWWEQRLPEITGDVDRTDTLWFAFISTSTIGLGDFFLQPEVIFGTDVMKYSLLFLVGFVFLSTFFQKIAECLALLMPQKHNSFEARLAATRVLACWPRGFMPWETKPEETGVGADGGVPLDVVDLPADDQALLYRIEQLKELKPDPPAADDDEDNFDRTLVSELTGNPIHSLNVDLLQVEEKFLKEWLAVVQFQKERALRLREPAVDEEEAVPEAEQNASQTAEREPDSPSEATIDSPTENPAEATEAPQPESPQVEQDTMPSLDNEDDAVAQAEEETFNPLASFLGNTDEKK